MAIGKISGAMLYDNLERLGTDLRFDTDLVYFDVTNRRLGINNTNPQYNFDNRGNVRLGNLLLYSDRINSETGNVQIDAYNTIINGNLIIKGNETVISTSSLTILDPIINLHTNANLDPLLSNDGADVGLKFHYYEGSDTHAFLGRINTSGFLEYFAKGNDVANVFTGTVYGTIKSGELVVANTTNSTSSTTGSFRTAGGAGIAANLYVGQSATFNSNSLPNMDFRVRGNTTQNLLWARSSASYDQVLIGNTSTVAQLVPGAKLIINSSDSMLLPTGNNVQRPGNAGGTDTVGMFRFSTTTGTPEYYNGTTWKSVQTDFTVATDQQFDGDGVTAQFPLVANAITAGTIVTINGVVQAPSNAYSISGNTLTFVQAPVPGDLIDVRAITTSSQITNITSMNGLMSVYNDNNGVYIQTGYNSPQLTTFWEPRGAQVTALANITYCTTAGQAYCIDAFEANTYRSARYTVQVSNISAVQVSEILVLQGSGTTAMTEFNKLSIGGSLGSYVSNIGLPPAEITGVNSTLNHGRLYFTPVSNSVTIRIKKEYLSV